MLRKVLYCTVILSITYFGNTESHASSVLQSKYDESINNNTFVFRNNKNIKNTSDNNNTYVNTSNMTNNTKSNNYQFVPMNVSDLRAIIECNKDFQNIVNKYKIDLENNEIYELKKFYYRENIKIIKELLKFWYQYYKPQLNIDNLRYNSNTGMWTYDGQSEFNYSIGFDFYNNMDLTNQNKIIIRPVENNPILSIGINKYNNIINIYIHFQQNENLQDVIKQTLYDYCNINHSNVADILSNTTDEELIDSNYKISYKKDFNTIKIYQIQKDSDEGSGKEDTEELLLELNIGSIHNNYITITKHFEDETDLKDNQQSLIKTILTNYSNKLNNNTSVNIPEISYDEHNSLFKFGDSNYYNFGNDNKYAIYGEYTYEPRINIYPVGDRILTIETNRLPSIILNNFIKDYYSSHKTIELNLKNTAKSMYQQGDYAQSAEILYNMKDYHNAASHYEKAAHSVLNPQKRVEYYANAAQIFYDIKDHCNAASNYEQAAYNEEDTSKKMEYYNKEIGIYKEDKNYCKIADTWSYMAYNESNIQKKVGYLINAANIYLENKDYYNAAVSWNDAANHESDSSNKAQYYVKAGDAYTEIKDYNTVVNTHEKAENAYKLAADYYVITENYENALLNYLFAVEVNNFINKDKYYKKADEVIQKTNYYKNNIKSSWEALKNKYNNNPNSKEYKTIINRINAL